MRVVEFLSRLAALDDQRSLFCGKGENPLTSAHVYAYSDFVEAMGVRHVEALGWYTIDRRNEAFRAPYPHDATGLYMCTLTILGVRYFNTDLKLLLPVVCFYGKAWGLRKEFERLRESTVDTLRRLPPHQESRRGNIDGVLLRNKSSGYNRRDRRKEYWRTRSDGTQYQIVPSSEAVREGLQYSRVQYVHTGTGMFMDGDLPLGHRREDV